MRVLTSDWTASFPPQAVPADIKAKTPDPLLRGFFVVREPGPANQFLVSAPGVFLVGSESFPHMVFKACLTITSYSIPRGCRTGRVWDRLAVRFCCGGRSRAHDGSEHLDRRRHRPRHRRRPLICGRGLHRDHSKPRPLPAGASSLGCEPHSQSPRYGGFQ